MLSKQVEADPQPDRGSGPVIILTTVHTKGNYD